MRNLYLKLAAITALSCLSLYSFAQSKDQHPLEKMPVDLETDFALSALPAHLRADATVYLLDPKSGYFIAHQGTNGFICFIARTEWAWGEFRDDLAAPIAYDAEGARTIFPVYIRTAAMRASGKYTPLEIREAIIDSLKTGVYKAPSRSGISYMLAPVMRIYTGQADNNTVVTMTMPHYMFYAPYVTESDIGTNTDHWPVLVHPEEVFLGKGKGPYNYIIFAADKSQTEDIVNSDKQLMKRLADYKPYFMTTADHAHH